jgi:hypothetical protein
MLDFHNPISMQRIRPLEHEQNDDVIIFDRTCVVVIRRDCERLERYIFVIVLLLTRRVVFVSMER